MGGAVGGLRWQRVTLAAWTASYPQNTFEPLALSLGRAVGAFSCTLTGSRGSGRLVCSRQEEGLLPRGHLLHEHHPTRLWVETGGPAGAAVAAGAGQMRA